MKLNKLQQAQEDWRMHYKTKKNCVKNLSFFRQQLAQLPQFPRAKNETISWFDFFNHVSYRPADPSKDSHWSALYS